MASSDQIDLAASPPFRIGPLTVEPALRLVTAAASQTLEPRVMQVLVQLAMANGAIVSRDDLVRRCWEGRIVGDDVINRVIARLRRLLDEHGDAAVRIETITKVGYRLIGPVVLTAPSVRAPLATDIIETAFPATAESAATPPIANLRQWWVFAIAAVAFVALAATAWRAANLPPKPLQATLRLGEFKPIGAGVTAHLPASIESELRSAFGVNSAVQVTTREADYLLQGDVRRVGDKLRYAVHLDEIDDGAVLWTASTDYPANSELAPRQFAINASGVLRCALSNAATYPRRLPIRALSLYLQFCWEKSQPRGSAERSLDLARQLTKSVPDFSYGWSALAAMGSAPPGENAAVDALRTEAMAAARRALELDPDNAEAYASQAINFPRSDIVGREKVLKHALTLRPSDSGSEYGAYSALLMGVGRFKDGVQNAKRMVDQVPNELVPLRRVANAYYIAGDIASGDDAMATIDEIYGDRPELGFIRLQAAVLARRWSEADQRLASSVKDDRARTAYALAFNALRSGNPVSRSTAIASLKEMMPTARGPWIALLLAQLGEPDAALVSAARYADTGSGTATNAAILLDPMLASVRGLPGYVELLEKNGLMTYWKTTRTRPDFCTEPAAPAFCRSLA